MRFLWLSILLIVSPVILWAQTGSITGKVSRQDKAPIANASVFLSNATFGTSTAQDGTFTLSGVKPGQYELIVTTVGFEEYTQTVLVSKDQIKLNIILLPKVTQLHEVIITTNANWKKNFEMFKLDFLGTSENARKCKILNPRVLNFVYHRAKKSLEAYTYDFIEIENKALGYRVKFLLNTFNSDHINDIISWEGKILYADLPGSASQKKKWELKRRETYYGSSMHFFRSLNNGKLDSDGFVMMQLKRKPNKLRPPQELIQQKIDKFTAIKTNAANDSLRHWYELEKLTKYDDFLNRTPYRVGELVHDTDQPGIFAIKFPDYLYVIYTKKREEQEFRDIYRPLDMPNYETSVITLYKPYALFDLNGIVISSQSTLIEGTWSKSKIAEQLPVDYTPGDEKK